MAEIDTDPKQQIIIEPKKVLAPGASFNASPDAAPQSRGLGQAGGGRIEQKDLPQNYQPDNINTRPGEKSGFEVRIPGIKDPEQNIAIVNPSKESGLGFITRLEVDAPKIVNGEQRVYYRSYTNKDGTNPNDTGYITYKDGKAVSMTFTMSDKSTDGLPQTNKVELKNGASIEELRQQVQPSYSSTPGRLYSFDIKDNGILTINPQTTLSRGGSRGIEMERNAEGGFDIRVPSAQFTSFSWEKASLSQLVEKTVPLREQDQAIAKLKGQRYGVDDSRDVLKWTASNGDSGYFIFSKDPSNKGVICICQQGGVSFGNMGPGQTSPFLARKPVIYLYPTKETEVEVSVKLPSDAVFASLYPKMKDNKWSVVADPSGELRDKETNKKYSYLFWEAEQESPFVIETDKAYCIAGKDVESFLEQSLAKLGLNTKEINDFVVYWLPIMEKNNFNVVQFLEDSYTSKYPLTISPIPETSIRVFMVFKKSSAFLQTGNPMIKGTSRNGYTLVEWGGCNLDERNGQSIK